MKVVLCLLVATAAVLAVPVDQGILEKAEYSRYIDFPDGEGVMHKVDLETEPDWALIEEVTRNPANNQYSLFTRRNPRNGQTLVINNVNSVRNSNFNAAWPVAVVAHGWLSNQNTNINPTVRDAFLARADTNVIILDWRRLAMSDYATAVNGVPAVGRGLGQFLQFLNSATGIAFNNMHIIGFSLGAHLVGNAGRQLGGRAARVTGLDPAGPLWNLNRNRLAPGDAVYVEAIHTDGGNLIGALGIGSNVANVDFYPNGGNSQPGCVTNLCNHNRAWELFAVSITHNHLVGQQCTSSTQVTWDTCRGSRLALGNADLRKTGRGMFRLNTGRRHPF